MGGYQGFNLAEKLKTKADGVNSAKTLVEYNVLREQILKEAENAAIEGKYEYILYNNKLGDPKLLDQLEISLKSSGFQVDGGCDNDYSIHSQHNMYYIRISWR